MPTRYPNEQMHRIKYTKLTSGQIAPDRKTATAALHCVIDIERAIEPGCPLVEMAQQHGGGSICRTEPTVPENAYVRRDGAWTIQRAEYRLSDRARR